MQAALTDHADSPFDCAVHHEVRRRVEQALRKVPEPYRTTLILRDLEEMSYEEIAEVLEISPGTVKSRLTRGREALRQKLARYVKQAGDGLGVAAREPMVEQDRPQGLRPGIAGGRKVEVMP